MEDRAAESWNRLSADAIHALNNPLDLNLAAFPKTVVRRLHIWTHPGLDVHVGLVIAAPTNLNLAQEGVFRRISWDPNEDYRRVMTDDSTRQPLIAPTINVRDNAAPLAVVQQILESLSNLHFAPFAFPQSFGTDGEQCGVETFGYFGHARVSWWSMYEPALEPLVLWHRKIWSLLERVPTA